MLATMIPHISMLLRSALALLTAVVMAVAATAMAQDVPAVDCSGDDFVGGVTWDVTDDGNGLAHTMGDGYTYVSCDDGATWTRSAQPNATGYVIEVDPSDASIVYVGDFNNGVRRSTDYGRTFSAATTGIINEGVSALTVAPGGRVLAGTPTTGLFESLDYGQTWDALQGSPSGATIRSILLDPADENVIYIGTNGDGAFQSFDGGQTWAGFGPFSQVNVLRFHPQNPAVMIAAAWDGIWQSADGGSTWLLTGGPRNADLAFDPNNPSIAYRTSRLDGAHKSVDGGQTWTQVNNGLASAVGVLYAVHVLPSGTVLVGTEEGGVFRSDNGARSWTLVGAANAPGGQPPGGGNGGTSNTATLAIDIKFRGDNAKVKAGNDAKFKVTVTNNGPDASTDTEVSFDWTHKVFLGSPVGHAYSMTTSQGFCMPSYAVPDCDLGQIPSGGSVVIEFAGATERSERYTFNLDVLAGNAESADTVFATKAIESRYETTTTCVLILCTTEEKSGGGGATGWPLLVLLTACGILGRRRSRI